MDGRCTTASLRAHHQRCLAGERRELHLAVDMRREMARQGGFAGARIAEQAEQQRRAALARLLLEPAGDRLEGCVLMGREFGHEGPGTGVARHVAMRRILKQASPTTKKSRVET